MLRRSAASDPSIDAGMLDCRVTLMKPEYNQWGDEFLGWVPVADVWANVQPTTLAEKDQSDKLVMLTAVTVTIRFRADVVAAWKIVDGPHTYEILSIADVSRRRVMLQIGCREVV